MSSTAYPVEFCRELRRRVAEADLAFPHRPIRYEPGDVLELDFLTIWPEVRGRGCFHIEKFVGGGFAGQVYRCRLERLTLPPEAAGSGLREGGRYGVKVLVPPSRRARRFRDALYWLGFQSSFSAQVSASACRAGLLWQKAIHLAADGAFGDPGAVADVYAGFYDDAMQSYGEIREWVEGRTWRLEADANLAARRRWRTIAPEESGSPEYVGKRQFMGRLVRLLHAMGAPELARQYEWWTMKSQPNCLRREGGGLDGRLCAFDFRAGIVLLPFLPMSPADYRLIPAGLGRGSLVQFDRADLDRLRAFAAAHADVFEGHPGLIDALVQYEEAYRASMVDLTHHGLRLLVDPGVRQAVRGGLVDGYRAADLCDAEYAARLRKGGGRFALYYLLGAFPLLRRFLRRCRGHAAYRQHVHRFFGARAYRQRVWRAAVAKRLIEWVRRGRVGEARARSLLAHPAAFWTQRILVGWLPPKVHRCLAEPAYLWGRVCDACRFIRDFYRDAAFREQWLGDQVRAGYDDGMLSEQERDEILEHVRDPFIIKYLKALAVHFATLPVTQIVSVAVGVIAMVWILGRGGDWGAALVAFVAIVAFFQVFPVSPGSICRGLYVVYLMVRERNFRDYMIAAPLSFVKYLGYLAFPFQMITTYPALARFMGSRWAMDAVRFVPVFGEKGGLLEHMVFDLFFNVPRALGGWARTRAGLLLTLWLLLGLALLALAFGLWGLEPGSRAGVNTLIAGVVLFVMPRLVFYPILRRNQRRARTAE